MNIPIPRPDLCALFLLSVFFPIMSRNSAECLYITCTNKFPYSRDNRKIELLLCPMENLLFQMIFQFGIDMSSVYFLILFQSLEFFFCWVFYECYRVLLVLVPLLLLLLLKTSVLYCYFIVHSNYYQTNVCLFVCSFERVMRMTFSEQ